MIIKNRALILFIFGFASCLGLLNAQESREEWLPPEPKMDSFDWVQLNSGEWLKGEIIAMQDEVLIFDSDELDTLELDMDDVKLIRSPKSVSSRIGEKDIVEGSLLLDGESVKIRTHEGVETYPRAALMAVVPIASNKKLGVWKAKASLGSTLRSGNTDQTDYSARVELVRRTPGTRFNFDYLGQYSKTDDLETVDSQRGNAKFDIFFTSRFFARAPFLEYFSDPFQNLEYRITAGAALGYDVIVGADVDWTLTLGPAYQYTEFSTVESGNDSSADATAIVLSSEYSWDITSDIEFSLDYNGQFTGRESGGTTHHAEARFEIDITSDIDLDFSLIWDHTEVTVADENGVFPDSNDYKLITAIGYEF